MKKYFIYAASALALASCSSNDFVGDNDGNVQGTDNAAINFGGETGRMTRAAEYGGNKAAELLKNNFIVAGFKGTTPDAGIVSDKVFDHYNIVWADNTAGMTDDNTSNWSYVGKTQNGLANISEQTLKYWDYSADQYDYVAFSTGEAKLVTGEDEPTAGTQVKVTPVDAKKATTAAYTMKGDIEALSKCYIADLVTAYNQNHSDALEGQPEFGKEVTLKFRNMVSKVRVAFYETIPGYSVKDLQFYKAEDDQDNNADKASNTAASLYTTGTESFNKFYHEGTLTVYFPKVGKNNVGNSDYNKAHVSVNGENGSQDQTFGTLDYTAEILGTASNLPTFAGKSQDYYYTKVLPNETGTTLTLRVNYTLESTDGSNEEIKVYGAKAIIPAIYAQWKSNYAYTYIFKISDNTNGKTGLNDGPEGLYPITFDAVVMDTEEKEQSTITTVASPSITTYQKGHRYTQGPEYSKAQGDIYVMATNVSGENANKQLTLTGAKLYAVTGKNVTEATVHDALTIGSTTDENGKVTGRNGIELTPTAGVTDATVTIVPGVDGNDITVTSGEVVKLDASKLNAGTYAFVCNEKSGTSSIMTTLYIADGTETAEANKYYTTAECNDDDAVEAGKILTAGKVYYQKVENNGKTFAIKVITVVD